MPTIGDKMSNRPPPEVAGQLPERILRAHLRLIYNFLVEVRAYLEDSTLPDALEAITTMISNLEAILAGVLTATITDADGTSLIVTDSAGKRALRVYDERVVGTLDSIQLQLAELREALAGR